MSTTVPVDPQNNVFGKTADIVPQWAKLIVKNPKLADLVREFAVDYLLPKGYPCVLTSIFRPDVDANGNPGIHALWRACDIRSVLMPEHSAEDIREAFNKTHPYGDGRHETIPALNHCASQVSTPSTGEHFHIQVKS